MFCILNTIACWARWVYGIPEIMLEFVKILLAETNPKLGKKGQTNWVVNSKNRFCKGCGLSIGAFSLKRKLRVQVSTVPSHLT